MRLAARKAFRLPFPRRRQFTVWYEGVFAKRVGEWQHFSHRTVHGPIYDKH